MPNDPEIIIDIDAETEKVDKSNQLIRNPN